MSEPLDLTRTPFFIGFEPPTKPSIVELTWKRLEAKLRRGGGKQSRICEARGIYTAAVYACAAAISHERAHSRELAETAERIEHG